MFCRSGLGPVGVGRGGVGGGGLAGLVGLLEGGEAEVVGCHAGAFGWGFCFVCIGSPDFAAIRGCYALG